jgi:hypothetical protein
VTWRTASLIQIAAATVCLPVFWVTGWIYSVAVVNTVTLVTVIQTAFAAWRADSPNPRRKR